MKNRSIANILKSKKINMGGTLVKQPLPTTRVDQVSPFLLLHHFGPTQVDPGSDPLDVGPHPHRGFEPVTFLYSGGIRHKDSRGNEGILGPGDVQWMTAGMGIIHSERASDEFLDTGGIMEGIQLWVNLPKASKMVQPRYQDIKSTTFPVIQKEGGSAIKVIAGKYEGEQGPAKTYTPILALQIQLKSGQEVTLAVPVSYNAMAYILKGELTTSGGFTYQKETLLHYKNDADQLTLKATEDTDVLVLAGEPIEEPVAQWGPYVMNTQTEVLEAMRDYQMGKMGFYVD